MFWYSTVPRCLKSLKDEERSCEAFVAAETFICSPGVNSDAMYHETRTKPSGVSEYGLDPGRKPETISWFEVKDLMFDANGGMILLYFWKTPEEPARNH